MDKPGVTHTHYLNPSTLKIKNSFRRNKKKEELSNSQSLTPSTVPDKRTNTCQQSPTISLMDSMTIPLEFTKKKQAHEASLPHKPHLLLKDRERHSEEYSFVIDRNKTLQEELKMKTVRIDDLGRRCQMLEMRLLAQNTSKNRTISLLKEDNEPVQLTISAERRQRCDKLREIKDKLQKVNFQGVLGHLHKKGSPFRKGENL